MQSPYHTGGRVSPSFAQTQAEFTLNDSEDDDDDYAEDFGRRERELAVGGEAYELRDRIDTGAGAGDDVYDGEHGNGWAARGEDGRGPGVRSLSPSPSSAGRRQRRRRTSASTVASFQLYTPDEERAVVRKFDRRLVAFLALLYMMSFVDRSNIGNARVAGMEEDLQTSPPRSSWYDWSLTAFYITYISFEWMSLLWRLIPAHIYVSAIVASWGVAASLQAVAVSYPMLVALRAVLGIGEAGFTGVPFYLSFFFKRHELAFRTAMFISAAPLASTFASSLAWVIIKFARTGPIAPWRLLFLLEGFPSVVVAVVAWHVIPDSPQTARYLTPREKKVARLRLRNEKIASGKDGGGGGGGNKKSAKPAPAAGAKILESLQVFRDPVAWLTAAMFFLANMAYSSLPVFLPKILTQMGHDALVSQALCVPPYLLAFFLVLFTAHLSDRTRNRAYPLVFHSLASALGYGVLALSRRLSLDPMFRYLAVYPATIGFFNVVTLIIAWNINNQASEGRQGSGFALLQVIGQCGPLVGTRLYPDGDGPFYTRGMSVCACAMLAVAVLALVLRFYMAYLNRKMDAADKGVQGEATAEEEEELVGSGDRKLPRAGKFRYML